MSYDAEKYRGREREKRAERLLTRAEEWREEYNAELLRLGAEGYEAGDVRWDETMGDFEMLASFLLEDFT